MKTLCVVLTALLLAASAQARLGETEDQIVARLGEPMIHYGARSASFSRTYMVPGFTVLVRYEYGVSVSESYVPQVRVGDTQVSGKMKREDAETIVFANGGRPAWHHDDKLDPGDCFYYQRDDGAYALINRDGTGVELYLRRKPSTPSESLKNF